MGVLKRIGNFLKNIIVCGRCGAKRRNRKEADEELTLAVVSLSSKFVVTQELLKETNRIHASNDDPQRSSNETVQDESGSQDDSCDEISVDEIMNGLFVQSQQHSISDANSFKTLVENVECVEHLFEISQQANELQHGHGDHFIVNNIEQVEHETEVIGDGLQQSDIEISLENNTDAATEVIPADNQIQPTDDDVQLQRNNDYVVEFSYEDLQQIEPSSTTTRQGFEEDQQQQQQQQQQFHVGTTVDSTTWNEVGFSFDDITDDANFDININGPDNFDPFDNIIREMMQQSISNQMRIQRIANPIPFATEGPSRDHVVWFRIDGNGHYQMVDNRQHGDIQRAHNGNYLLNREHFLLGELRFGLNYNDNGQFVHRPLLYVIRQPYKEFCNENKIVFSFLLLFLTLTSF